MSSSAVSAQRPRRNRTSRNLGSLALNPVAREQVCERRYAIRLAREQRKQLIRRAGLAEEFSLGEVAALLAQELEVPLRLHAFRNHVHSQAAPHIDDGAHDGGIARVFGYVTHERLIDLQRADR